MDRKTILWVVLLGLIFLFWQPILDVVWPQPKVFPTAVVTNAPTNSGGGVVNSSAPAPASAVNGMVSRLKPETTPSKSIFLETEKMRVEFSESGGGIRSVQLKEYSLPGEGDTLLNMGSPLPVLAVEVGDIRLDDRYQLVVSGHELLATLQTPSGLQIEKHFSFTNDYQIVANLLLSNRSKTGVTQLPLEIGLGLAAHSDKLDGVRNPPGKNFKTLDDLGISYLGTDKVRHETLPGLKKFVDKQHRPWSQTDSIHWAAVKNQYFTLLTTPTLPFAQIHAEIYQMTSLTNGGTAEQGILAVAQTGPVTLQPGTSTNFTFLVYSGPKELKRLSELGNRQGEVLNLSWQTIAHALLWAMTLAHSWFHNWGVAIICVTIAIKILFWPLTMISTRSMKQMQALAPKMNVIKEKYKDDPKKVNEETMKLYRDYRVNPLAGCLPMLVQIPIFFAFYSMLRSSIELRGASFLWIHDLSLPDTIAFIPGTHMPINLMPLIMAVTMIWQTKITPQAPNADPSMKMMMWFMPVTFLFFCYNFSSGLSLYWTVQNLLTILQTWLTKDKPVEPPQKTKRKGGGGGFSFSRPS